MFYCTPVAVIWLMVECYRDKGQRSKMANKGLKGIVHPKCKFCHYLLTLMLFQTCVFLSSAEHKRRYLVTLHLKYLCITHYKWLLKGIMHYNSS